MKTLSWTVLAAVLLIIFCQAQSFRWQEHLHTDVAVFHDRAMPFANTGSWANMGYNEYQPGALWFFVLVLKLTNNHSSFGVFQQTFIWVNIFLIIAHFIFFSRVSHKYAPILFSLLVLAAGPIMFYRFELLVSLLVLVAWHLFCRKKYGWSAFALALGTSIKLYPVILFPLLILEIIRKKNWRSMVAAVLAFAAGLALPLFSFLAFGGNFQGLLTSIRVHSLKPIGLESLWGNLFAFLNADFGSPFNVLNEYGVHGVALNSNLLSAANLNKLPVVATIILLAAIGWFYRKKGYNEAGLAFVAIFAFTLLGKVLNPQYLWWFLVFLPYLSLKLFFRIGWITIYIMAFASLVITQVIYPLNYNAFLVWFKTPVELNQFFVLLSLRNLLLLAILGFGAIALVRSRTAKAS